MPRVASTHTHTHTPVLRKKQEKKRLVGRVDTAVYLYAEIQKPSKGRIHRERKGSHDINYECRYAADSILHTCYKLSYRRPFRPVRESMYGSAKIYRRAGACLLRIPPAIPAQRLRHALCGEGRVVRKGRVRCDRMQQHHAKLYLTSHVYVQ